jgi:hypothetical protein
MYEHEFYITSIRILKIKFYDRLMRLLSLANTKILCFIGILKYSIIVCFGQTLREFSKSYDVCFNGQQ